jgi:uncharacterized protein YdiU (UPF0061 family)
MHTTNPLVIPRNHMVEEALAAANNGDIVPVHNILKVIKKPYIDQKNISIFQNPNPQGNEDYKTFCGT